MRWCRGDQTSPGPWSLGCTGLLYLVSAVGLLIGVASSIGKVDGLAIALLAVSALLSAAVGGGSLLASQKLD